MFEDIKCLFKGCKWVYDNDFADGLNGRICGKTYICSRCGLIKDITIPDGRVYIRQGVKPYRKANT